VNCNPRPLQRNEDLLYIDEERSSVEQMISSRLGDNCQDLEKFTRAVRACVHLVRTRMDERAIISYRDIGRVCPIFNHVKVTIDQCSVKEKVRSPERALKEFRMCSMVSLMICFCLRLPGTSGLL
jgi:hypothetical protein